METPDRRRRLTNMLMAQQFDRATPHDGGVVERGTIAPVGTYENGQTGLAWPGLIAEPVAAFGRIANRLMTEGYQPGDSRNAVDAFEVAGGAMAGSIPAGRPTNALGTFGGRLARTADHGALARAEALEKSGAPREQIWSDTGWFKGVDGKWRFEIDDSGASYWGPTSRDVKTGDATTGKVGDWYAHHQIMKAYPDLKKQDLTIENNGGILGAYYGDSYMVNVDPSVKMSPRSILAHEIQHGIQGIENFANGASNLPRNEYVRLAGEVEARTVQKRMDMTPDERRARPPWLDYSVPEDQQIVRNAGSVNQLLARYGGR